jgi:hypothetical protein
MWRKAKKEQNNPAGKDPAPEHDPSDRADQQSAIQSSDSRLLELLQTSYREVLDATKHQDDKVGRLLAATAFLTAASLALANLVGGNALPRRFSLHGESLPAMSLLSLGAFLLCIIFAAAMLLNSISTPLKIPSFADDPSNTKTMQPGGRFSQIYFYSIAGASRAQWEKKWGGDVLELEKQLPGMYTREVQNIAVRADFKYNRTNEGVAVLNLALLAFASAVIFVFGASIAPCDRGAGANGVCTTPVELTPWYRIALGTTVALWIFTSLITQLRYGRLYIDELVGMFRPEGGFGQWFRAWAGRVFAIAISASSALLIIRPPFAPPASLRAWITIALLLVGIITLLVTHRWTAGSETSGTPWGANVLVFCMALAITSAIALTIVSEAKDKYSYDLLAGYLLPAGVALAALAGPTAVTAERRSKARRTALFEKAQAEAKEGESGQEA